MGSWKVAMVLLGLVATSLMTATLVSSIAQRKAMTTRSAETENGMLEPLQETFGKVEWIDEARHELSVRVERNLRRFRVDATTTVFVAGRTGNLSDLVPGQVVKASYERGTERPIAQWIEVED
jgi:hypothetical protein